MKAGSELMLMDITRGSDSRTPKIAIGYQGQNSSAKSKAVTHPDVPQRKDEGALRVRHTVGTLVTKKKL